MDSTTSTTLAMKPPPNSDQTAPSVMEQAQSSPTQRIQTPTETNDRTSNASNVATTSPAAGISAPINAVLTTQPIMVNKAPSPIITSQVQQAPLALTTNSNQLKQSPLQAASLPKTSSPVAQNQLAEQQQPISLAVTQTKNQPIITQVPMNSATLNQQSIQSIALATAPTTTGQTALVIIPQHSTTTTLAATKVNTTAAIKTTPVITATTSIGLTPTHVTLAAAPNSTPIQLTTQPLNKHLTPVPMTAHQQIPTTTIVQTTVASRPPSTLPVVPITSTAPSAANVKTESNKIICCLLDNNVRCDRVAGNASFSLRIQKIVASKKLSFTLDQNARHTYICEHHKGIITVAKKSTVAKEPKANARNYNNANNTNAYVPQTNNKHYNAQQSVSIPVNMDTSNSGRVINNHAMTMGSLPIRPGPGYSYGQYNSSQVVPMDVTMSTNLSNAGEDKVPSSSMSVDVDLQQLQVNTLRRYKRHFRVQTRPGLNKVQLAESLKGHFRSLPIIEKEAITYFVYIVKCYRNKLDHNPKAD